MLLDAASMYFRAFHGIPQTFRSADGATPVNAVRGILDMIATLVRTHRPDGLVACLDFDWRPAWRVELLPSYKTHRMVPGNPAQDAPDELEIQVPIIIDMLTALGIATAGAKDHEADDVIGTFVARTDGPVDVVTGDRDLFQLVDDSRPVRVLYIGRGVAKLEVMDNAAVQRKYGIPAASYADMATLRGDPSDGLPGVPGIGEKTAASLINTYGDLAGIVAAAEDGGSGISPALARKVTAASDYLAVAPKVVLVAPDAPVPAVDTSMPAEPEDADWLSELTAKWAVESSVERVTKALYGG
jgi:5'-3' exonuclease